MTEDQELELFAIRSKYFRDIPHPKLILKSINQVEKYLDKIPLVPVYPNSFEKLPLLDVLRMYTNSILALKTKLAQASDAGSIFLILHEIYGLQLSLLKQASHYAPSEAQVAAPEIKQSEPFDTWAILRYLEQQAIPENEIMGYICQELAEKPMELSNLSRFCIQAQKITQNG